MVAGDFIFQSHSRQLARDLSAAGKPTFLYHFTDPDARLPAALFPDAPPEDALGGALCMPGIICIANF